MNDRAVVSCPRCVRQFKIDATSDRLVAQCGVCKAHFVLIIPRLTAPAEDALVLEEEIEPSFAFFQEGCEALARNICELLGLVEMPITPRYFTLVLNSLPKDRKDLGSETWRKGFLSEMLFRLHRNRLGDEEQRERLFYYFLRYIPDRPCYSLDMLQAAFTGVLVGIPWPESVAAAVEEDRPDASGIATTPLPPRLKRFSWLSGKS